MLHIILFGMRFATLNNQGEGIPMNQHTWGQRTQWIGYGLLLFAISTCGGSSGSSSSSTDTGATVTLTGSILEPTVVSANLSAATKGGTLRIADTPAVSTAFVINTFEGETIATGTTDADGNYSVTVPIADLAGTEDTATSFTEDIAVVSEGGTQNIAQVTVDSTTTTIAAGTANSETTTAALQTAVAISDSWDGWETDYKTEIAEAGLDTDCLYLTNKAIFENSSTDAGGVSTDAESVKSIVSALIAAGTDPVSIKDIIDGTADDKGSLSTLAATAVGTDPNLDSAALEADFATYSGSVGAVRDVLTAQFITDGPGAANCAAIKDGTMDATAIGDTLLAGEDGDSVSEFYGSADGGKVFASLLASCISAGEAGCEAKNAPSAFYGFFKSSTGTIGDFIGADGTVDATKMGIGLAFIGSCTGTATVQKNCGQAGVATILAAGGYSYFSDTAGAAATALYLREYIKTNSVSADSINYGTIVNSYLSTIIGAKATAGDCVATGGTNCFGSSVPAASGGTLTCENNCGSTFVSNTGGTITGLTNGQGCTAASQCTSGNCSSGICAAVVTTTSTGTTLKANGLSCTAAAQCTSGNCASGFCAEVVSLTGFAGTYSGINSACTQSSMNTSSYTVTFTGSNPYAVMPTMGSSMMTINLATGSCTSSSPSSGACSSCSYTGTSSASSQIVSTCPVGVGLTCTYTFTKQ